MQDNQSSVSGRSMYIDDYDDYDPTNDQFEIDNYSIIGNNISKLKRVLGWFGLSSNDNFNDIGDWSIDDNVELYNLDGNGNMNGNGEDVVGILRREKISKIKRILIRFVGLIALGFLFFYIVVNLVIVNKEYSEIKEAHSSAITAVAVSTPTSVEDNIFSHQSVYSNSYSFSKTSSSIKSAVSKTSITSLPSKTSTTTTVSKTTSKSKSSASKPTSKSKAKTTTKGKSKTTTTATANGLASMIEEIVEDAKEIGEEILDGINGLVDGINHKIHDSK